MKDHKACLSGEPFVALATFIDITLELLGCSVFMNPQIFLFQNRDSSQTFQLPTPTFRYHIQEKEP